MCAAPGRRLRLFGEEEEEEATFGGGPPKYPKVMAHVPVVLGQGQLF